MRGAHHKGTGCHRNKFNSCLQLTSAARELIRLILSCSDNRLISLSSSSRPETKRTIMKKRQGGPLYRSASSTGLGPTTPFRHSWQVFRKETTTQHKKLLLYLRGSNKPIKLILTTEDHNDQDLMDVSSEIKSRLQEVKN